MTTTEGTDGKNNGIGGKRRLGAPGDGRGIWWRAGFEGNSPRGEEGERELNEEEVDMLLLLLRSPLPSSDRPEPGRDLVDQGLVSLVD